MHGELVMDILKELKTSWPDEYELQPNTARQRHDVIAIQSLKKRAAVEIEIGRAHV